MDNARATATESVGYTIDQSAEDFQAQMHEVDELIDSMNEKLKVRLPSGKHLVRFITNFGSVSEREQLRIEIDSGAHVATIMTYAETGEKRAYHIHIPTEILHRTPLAMLQYIMNKHLSGQYWTGMAP